MYFLHIFLLNKYYFESYRKMIANAYKLRENITKHFNIIKHFFCELKMHEIFKMCRRSMRIF